MFVLKKEQYLAAEVMYAQLDLCSVIQKLLHDLPDDVISNCLSHVILAGKCQYSSKLLNRPSYKYNYFYIE